MRDLRHTAERIGILEPQDFSKQAFTMLQRLGSVERCEPTVAISEFVANKTSLFVRLGHMIDGRLFAAAPCLKTIVSPTTALNHIDLEAARQSRVTVLSLRGETEFLRSITATPEHALGLIIALLRNYRHAFLGAGTKAWNRDVLRGTNIAGTRIGIIGLGRVGRWLARILLTLDASVSYEDTDPATQELPGAARMPSKESLISQSDVVVLSASYTNGQQPILTAPLLELMRGKHLVNIARGELIDEATLVRLIGDGHFAGVALDVVDGEVSGSPRLALLRELSTRFNVIVTPHIGGSTLQSIHATEVFMAHKLLEHVGMRSV